MTTLQILREKLYATDGPVTLQRFEMENVIVELDQLETTLQLAREEIQQIQAAHDLHEEDSQLLDWLEAAHGSTWSARAIDYDGKEIEPARWVHGIRHGARATARMSLREAIRDAMKLTKETPS
jgi:hypothetical protein